MKKNFKLIISIVIFSAMLFLAQQIISKSISNQIDKQDLAEVNHIKYGLFSINKWKEQLAVIIADEIKDLNLSDANEKELKKHVEIQLNVLIDNVSEKIREKNKGTAKGWMKQAFINSFVSLKDIKEGIPEYADAIIVQMTKTRTENQLKDLVQKRIEKYFDKTFEAQDITQLTRVQMRTASADIEGARVVLSQRIEASQKQIFHEAWLLIALAVVLFVIAGLSKEKLPGSQYAFLLLSLVTLLLVGITVPMIDMEAKISEMSFTLLGHPISFINQVLYFQSKSILDVFWIMVTHPDLQMKIVGVLVVSFSVVFPIVKMASSIFYYYNVKQAREKSWIRFFVFKSGKWSMSDVLVVAIFMAYIGFNGIITSQFGSLSKTEQEIVILTTNGTSLQPGFYIFLTYTLLALFLSGFLTKIPPIKNTAN